MVEALKATLSNRFASRRFVSSLPFGRITTPSVPVEVNAGVLETSGNVVVSELGPLGANILADEVVSDTGKTPEVTRDFGKVFEKDSNACSRDGTGKALLTIPAHTDLAPSEVQFSFADESYGTPPALLLPTAGEDFGPP